MTPAAYPIARGQVAKSVWRRPESLEAGGIKPNEEEKCATMVEKSGNMEEKGTRMAMLPTLDAPVKNFAALIQLKNETKRH
ncbi:hypothetical protein ACLOJK_005897 [Asimina triloba]